MARPRQIVGFSLVLGGLLRVYGLGSESLWIDEAATVRRMGMGFRALFFDTGAEVHLPLYFWISKIWWILAGSSEVALRTPALAFGILLIPAVFLAGRELVDEEVGAWGALFAAVNPYLIHYSQEARPYSLWALLAVLSWFFLARWIGARLTGQQGLPEWVGFTLTTLAVLYVHPLGVLILPLDLVLFLSYGRGGQIEWRRGEGRGVRLPVSTLRVFFAVLGVALLVYLPVFYRLVRSLAEKVEGNPAAAWIPDAGWAHLLDTASRYFMDSWSAVMAGLMVAWAILLAYRTMDEGGPGQRLLITGLGGAIFLVGLPWVVSRTLTPIYVHRYTMPFLPLLLLMMALGVSGMTPMVRKVVVGAFLVFTVFPVWSYHTRIDKPPWRETFRQLREEMAPGDLLIRDPGWISPLSDYYFTPEPPGVEALSPYSMAEVADTIPGARELWILTVEGFELGFAEGLEAGEIPGWELLSRRPIPPPVEANPRAIRLLPVTLSHFGPSGQGRLAP